MSSYNERLKRERDHYNRITGAVPLDSLRMASTNIARYASPPASTPYPLEFAFHLLGPLAGRTVLELGCGDGLNTVLLASHGASVIGIDVSEANLSLTRARLLANEVLSRAHLLQGDVAELPLADESVDTVLSVALLHHTDPARAAAEIRRVLKADGSAVVLEPVAPPFPLQMLKQFIPSAPGTSPDEAPLTARQVAEVNRIVGSPGALRAFGLIARLVGRLRPDGQLAAAHKLDAWIFHCLPPLRRIASPLVWEIRKLPVVTSRDGGADCR